MARKQKITENEKYTLQDVQYGEEYRKMWKFQKCPLQDMEYGKKTENHGKLEIHTLGRDIQPGKLKKGGIFRNVHCRMWNMARKLKIMVNEKYHLDELKNDEITKKLEK